MARRQKTTAPKSSRAMRRDKASNRQCVCPKNEAQDGVCGCPQFWQPKAARNQAQHNTSAAPTAPKAMVDAQKPPSPLPTPAGPPQQTCFFWYHGNCRRDPCSMAHESHVTWPLTPPPGFVHYEPCLLPLCPLRDDLVPSKQTLRRQLVGQLDGTAVSCGTRETPLEVTSSDEESNDTDTDTDAINDEDKQDREELDSLLDYEDLPPIPDWTYADYLASLIDPWSLFGESDTGYLIAPGGLNFDFSDAGSSDTFVSAVEDIVNSHPLFEPGSRPLTGPYADCSDSDCDTLVETEVKEGETTHLDAKSSTTTATTPSSPTFDTEDYVDLSEYAPPAPSSDTNDDGDEPLLSLSHPGTLGKRNRTTSPNPNDTDGLENKRARREPMPDLDKFVSILQRKRRVNNWDRRPLDVNDLLPVSVTLTSPALRRRAGIPARISTARAFARSETPSPSSVVTVLSTPTLVSTPTPTGPRALGGGAPVCFYWYHQGYCRPKRKNGRTIRCLYAHTLDNPRAKVSLPPVLRSHDPDCQLPLCPVRLDHDDHARVRKSDEPGSSALSPADLESGEHILTYEDALPSLDPRALNGRRARAFFAADLATGGCIAKYDPAAELYREEYQPLDRFPDSEPEEDPRDKAESLKEHGEKAMERVEALKARMKGKSKGKKKGGRKAGKEGLDWDVVLEGLLGGAE